MNYIDPANSGISRSSFQPAGQHVRRQDEQGSPEPRDKVEIGTAGKEEPRLLSAPKMLGLPAPTPEKELTVLYYMNGQYDDIGTHTANAILDLEKTGPDENVNLVAQLGRNPYKPKEDDESFHVPVDGDWAGVRRYEIRQNSHSYQDVPLSEWTKLEPQMPKNPVLKYVIGNYYFEMGDKEQARKYHDEARSLGMVEYMNDPKSDTSKAIRNEFDQLTRPMDEAIVDKKVIYSEMLRELDPSTQMKDPSTLKDFVSWGMMKYPAKHYMLVIMGHGGAWMGASAMSPTKMADAINDGIEMASDGTGKEKKLDALIFNSCYMGNAEAMTEFKDSAAVTLASENYATTGIFDDWNKLMTDVKKDLKEGKPFDSRKLASDMVEEYRKENLETKENFPDFFPWRKSYLTLTALDNKKMDGLVGSWEKFNKSCKENNVSDKDLFTAVAQSKDYASGAYVPKQVFGFYDQIRDMGDIMDNVKKSETIPEAVKKAADGVKKALKDVIINEQHEGVGMEGSQGLTVWGPTNGVDVIFMGQGYTADVPNFAWKTGWSDRLVDALRNTPKPVTQQFVKNYNDINDLKRKLNAPGTPEEDKKGIQEQIDKLADENVELKKKMDFTQNQPPSLFKAESTLNLSRFEGIFDEEAAQAVKRDGMASEGNNRVR
jgi:hypothetical protein